MNTDDMNDKVLLYLAIDEEIARRDLLRAKGAARTTEEQAELARINNWLTDHGVRP